MSARVQSSPAAGIGLSGDFITATVGGQLFGIPVLSAQDVLNPQRIHPIPLAPPHVAGSLNLRGRIVTAINLRVCLGLPPGDPARSMSIVIGDRGEFYSLLVDTVGEVLSPPGGSWERIPMTISPRWRDLCAGVCRLDGVLMLALNVDRVLTRDVAEAA